MMVTDQRFSMELQSRINEHCYFDANGATMYHVLDGSASINNEG